jgi:hypothetical protein
VGIAIVSRLAIGCELQIGSPVVISIEDLVIRRPLHLQKLRSKNSSPAVSQLLKLLHTHKDKTIQRDFKTDSFQTLHSLKTDESVVE